MNSYWCSFERNWLNTATLSASSETAEQPVANLVNPHLSAPWRALSTSPWFRADFATPKAVRHLSLHGMRNVTAAAKVRWRLSNVAPGDGELLDTQITLGVARLTEDDVARLTEDDEARLEESASVTDLAMNVERKFDQFGYVLEEEITARYSQVDILDPTNAAGHLDIGAASIGAGFITSRNFDYGLTPGVASTTQGQATPGGQTYFAQGVRVRSIFGGYRFLTRAEALGPIQDLLLSADENNALFIPFPNDPLHGREMVFGLLPKDNQTPLLQAGPDGRTYGWGFTMTERL